MTEVLVVGTVAEVTTETVEEEAAIAIFHRPVAGAMIVHEVLLDGLELVLLLVEVSVCPPHNYWFQ